MSDLVTDLLRPDAYPVPPPDGVELRETHISSVFLTASDVYKVKKPVVFPFLDFGTLEKRRRACEAEVVLNQRLATGVYLGVVPVRRGADGRCHVRPDGEIVDWAVHMLRLPDALRADMKLAEGTLGKDDIDAIAAHLAAFHARVRSDATTAQWGTPDAIEESVIDNFEETRAAAAAYLSEAERDELEAWQLGLLGARRRTFERRCLGGFVREGHGDLRLDHIYLGPEPRGITVLDCIEFSDRFRCGDVASDLAFLSMDLAARGHVDLAERLIARYARESNDYELYEVIDFYESYRACVRAKIATIMGAEADARRHFALALASHRSALLPPMVVAVGGPIASGKSTVAEVIANRLSAPVLDADRTRKHLLGVRPTERMPAAAFDGAYDTRVTDRVYAEMMWRASIVLESRRSVVLDASFRTVEMRLAARELAREHGVPFLVVECRARPEVCKERLARREKEMTVSDGRREIFDAFVARWQPMTELPRGQHLVVDTERPLGDTLASVERRIATWPEGLVA